MIQVEAVNDLVDNPYLDSSNYEHDFDKLLLNQYEKIGRGSGFVKPGTICRKHTRCLICINIIL